MKRWILIVLLIAGCQYIEPYAEPIESTGEVLTAIGTSSGIPYLALAGVALTGIGILLKQKRRPKMAEITKVTKPGLLTTEFYVTASTVVIGILIAVGVIDPLDVSEVAEKIETNYLPLAEAVVRIVGAIVAAILAQNYATNRTVAKQ